MIGKLSTFTGAPIASGKASLVQMRRPTNKRGKQAPAPPKRTRYHIILRILTYRLFSENLF